MVRDHSKGHVSGCLLGLWVPAFSSRHRQQSTLACLSNWHPPSEWPALNEATGAGRMRVRCVCLCEKDVQVLYNPLVQAGRARCCRPTWVWHCVSTFCQGLGVGNTSLTTEQSNAGGGQMAEATHQSSVASQGSAPGMSQSNTDGHETGTSGHIQSDFLIAICYQ